MKLQLMLMNLMDAYLQRHVRQSVNVGRDD